MLQKTLLSINSKIKSCIYEKFLEIERLYFVLSGVRFKR